MFPQLISKLQRSLQWVAVKVIHGYRYVLSPWIGNQCRFYPSCSHYAEDAIIQYGFFSGFYLTLRRLLKCHPWHQGGLDPVPQRKHSCCSTIHSHTIDGSK